MIGACESGLLMTFIQVTWGNLTHLHLLFSDILCQRGTEWNVLLWQCSSLYPFTDTDFSSLSLHPLPVYLFCFLLLLLLLLVKSVLHLSYFIFSFFYVSLLLSLQPSALLFLSGCVVAVHWHDGLPFHSAQKSITRGKHGEWLKGNGSQQGKKNYTWQVLNRHGWPRRGLKEREKH